MEDLEEDPSYRWWVGGPNQLGLFLVGKLPQLLWNVVRSQGWEVKAAGSRDRKDYLLLYQLSLQYPHLQNLAGSQFARTPVWESCFAVLTQRHWVNSRRVVG